MWVNAKKELPSASGYYLCYANGIYQVIPYSEVHRLFNAHDGNSYRTAHRYAISVAFWMPIPELPTEARQ